MMLNNPLILILGSKGQVGKQFQKELSARNIRFVAPDEADCDITKFDELSRSIDRIEPTVIINCAAYNAVDVAEADDSLAYLINSKAVENVAKICNKNRIFLVHYSTDYVFDGDKGDFYYENDKTNPLNVYGKSKLAGEKAVLETTTDSLVFRPSWVYGDGTQNFIYKLSGWAMNNRILKISSDEVSVPTSAVDIVNVTLEALEKGANGLYHLTNGNYCSRYEWCRFVLDTLGKDNIVIPVPMSSFKSPAKRPIFTAMSNKLISDKLGIQIPHWKESLRAFLTSK
jgi:dTDP-4-dehydrorhamnose reductase